jgi:hypothetical protein
MFFDLEEFKKENPPSRAGSASSISSNTSIISTKPPSLASIVKLEPKPKTYSRPFGYIHIPKEPYLLFLLKYIPTTITDTTKMHLVKYLLTEELFKKALYNEDIKELYSHYIDIIPKTKVKYIQKPYTYKNFLTFTRQICNQFDWKYDNRVKYLYNVYNIYYDIYVPIKLIEVLI